MPLARYQHALMLITDMTLEELCTPVDQANLNEAARRLTRIIHTAQEHHQQHMTELLDLREYLATVTIPAPEPTQALPEPAKALPEPTEPAYQPKTSSRAGFTQAEGKTFLGLLNSEGSDETIAAILRQDASTIRRLRQHEAPQAQTSPTAPPP